MCGLFGFTMNGAREIPEHIVSAGRRARDSLEHRGPDDFGESMAEGVYLGHRRLTILDLTKSGHQPMISDDGKVAIAVNGEIYNFRKLRAELGVKNFKSGSDSEVVLHGYYRWGIEGLLKKLDGMYAISIHDRATDTVYLARDRAGIKPLYLGRVDGLCVWGSELKAIKFFARHLGHELHVNSEALYDFLTYGYIPTPKTCFKEITKVPPGCYIEIFRNKSNWKVQRYWQLAAPRKSEIAVPGREKLADISNEVYNVLHESVGEQLISDVPLGYFLSGGIDSTSVVAHARDNTVNRTFSIGWDIESHDETEYAQIAAEAYRTQHTVSRLGDEDAVELIERMFQWYDEPHADASILPTFAVSKLARRDVKVVLTGDGGDELFGGYKWYERFQRFRLGMNVLGPLHRLLPRSSINASGGAGRRIYKRLMLLGQHGPLELYAALHGSPDERTLGYYRKLLEIPAEYDRFWAFRRWWFPELGTRRALQYVDFHTYLPEDILTKVDRASMSVSLEARVPFLSRKLIELAFQLPAEWLYLGGRLKGGLKDAHKNCIPDKILNREKKGFSIPLRRWNSVGKNSPERFRCELLEKWL